MEKYIEIFNKLWEHSENEVVEFKKAVLAGRGLVTTRVFHSY